MKKSLFIIAALGISFVACKKEYTCECTVKDNGTVVSTSSVTFEAKKKDAESTCNGKATVSGGGSTLSSECKLK